MFKFALEPIRKYKEERVNILLKELEALYRKVREETEVLFNLRDKYVERKNQLMQALVDGFYEKEKIYNVYLDSLKKDIMDQLVLINAAKNDVALKEHLIVKAKQEQKLMDELRDKEYKKYLLEERKIENKQMDDFSTFKGGFHKNVG